MRLPLWLSLQNFGFYGRCFEFTVAPALSRSASAQVTNYILHSHVFNGQGSEDNGKGEGVSQCFHFGFLGSCGHRSALIQQYQYQPLTSITSQPGGQLYSNLPTSTPPRSLEDGAHQEQGGR